MRFDPTVPPGNFRIRIRRYSETAAPPRMPSLRVSRRPLRFTQAPSPPPAGPAHRSGGAVRDLRARNHARATLGESRPVAPSAAPRWCPRPPRPHSTGPAPADAHSAPRGPPRPLGGLARAARSPESLGHCRRARGGGAGLRERLRHGGVSRGDATT